jgi:hypothetical protein
MVGKSMDATILQFPAQVHAASYVEPFEDEYLQMMSSSDSVMEEGAGAAIGFVGQSGQARNELPAETGSSDYRRETQQDQDYVPAEVGNSYSEQGGSAQSGPTVA